MVTPRAWSPCSVLLPAWWAAEKQAEPLLKRLDPETRAKVFMALLALVLVGLGLVALAWLGGRRLRHLAHKPLPPTSSGENRWYRKPLAPPDASRGGDDTT
jgi:hypothetical protein